MEWHDLTAWQWLLVGISAIAAGISKCGFNGVSLVAILLMASIFGDKLSTGILLPLLCVADVCAVLLFRRHAVWRWILRTLPLALLGVGFGAFLMKNVIPDSLYKPLIGWSVLLLSVLQVWHIKQPKLFQKVPHSWIFAIVIGLLAGIFTMVANAAGQVMSLYFLAVGLPKYQLTGSSAWFFLILNFFKLPFSASLGLIDGQTLIFTALMSPVVLLGVLIGRNLLSIVSQRMFDGLILFFAIIFSIWRIFNV